MLSQVFGCGLLGVDGLIVTVEVDVSNGLPMYAVVGLPDVGIKESKERVYSALKNSGYTYPMKRITINLAPADLKKEGPAFDLPIAIGLLLSSEQLVANTIQEYVIVGELSLSGEIKGVRGVLPMVLAAKQHGFKGIIVPESNGAEASVVEGIDVFPASHISEVVAHLEGTIPIVPLHTPLSDILETKQESASICFSEIRGQESAKRALIIAAAGAHNILMSGPPGAGKSMMAKAFPSILPRLTPAEALEITKIYSIAGLLKNNQIIPERPFRSPHHTISNNSLIGGGRIPKPGEVSLAHLGVLFLDELPEFHKSALETLRQPMEDHQVTISRVKATLAYPAAFTLVASMNPCPCGYYGDPTHQCTCSENQVKRYTGRLSGPLLDRIDIRIEVPATQFDELEGGRTGETSIQIREKVNQARAIQNQRFADSPGIFFNSQLTPAGIDTFCKLDQESRRFMELMFTKLKLSARGYHRILKLARTIADLDDSTTIKMIHLSEAVQYRT